MNSRLTRLALVTGTAALALTTTGGPALAAPAPTVAVSPSTGLGDGQVVTVTGAGFTPGKLLAVGQCEMENLHCALDDDLEVTADKSGAFSTRITVRKAYKGTNPKDHTEQAVDCAAQACSIAAVDPADGGDNVEYGVSETLSFS
ncbi:hypothetical protein GCM10010124_28160 [Pilimelia terevasa]|uniref:Neocarzinostatin family protein n=1 Tax=Pilimelia terevasa TaxID=53372 RepID=A0A8J3BRV9_9ACTN|nr:enediyne antibiotic chromoprotein [Pilimelia terevasa]GGK33946.1 hypothetical protein GCM10010124_28160 [Pilimelia terevasa]